MTVFYFQMNEIWEYVAIWNANFNQNIILNLHVLKLKVSTPRTLTLSKFEFRIMFGLKLAFQ